jgi:glycosyltransferase involved in cell wall biosynthesis
MSLTQFTSCEGNAAGGIKRAHLPSVSAIVPVYNSMGSLEILVMQLRAVLARTSSEFEVILINDGSQDASWAVIRELAERYDDVHGIDLLRNYGQHNALLAGVRAASNEVIVTLDDDLQHPPEEIPKLLEKISEGYDVVYGKAANEQHDLWRTLASRITKLALKTTLGATVARDVGPFRAFRTHVRDAFQQYQNPFVNLDVLLTWGATRFVAVQVRHEERQFGKSSYTFVKLVSHALNMVTGFSVLPLQLASYIGFSLTLVGLLLLFYVLGRYVIQGGSVPGFPFLASVMTLFSGAQLFALGIIGEYLARIHLRTSERPTYVIRQTAATQVRAGVPVNGD